MRLPLKSKAPITSLAISPDGKWLAVGQDDKDDLPALTIWDTVAWKWVADVEKDRIRSLSFSRDSNSLAYATRNKVGFFNLGAMQLKDSVTAPDVEYVCYGRTRDLLLMAGRTVRVLNAPENKELWTYDDYTADFYNAFPAAAVFYQNDSSVMITGIGDTKFSVFDLQTGKMTAQFPGGVKRAYGMVTDNTEKYLWVKSRPPRIANFFWKLDTMTSHLEKDFNEENAISYAICFHPSSRFFAAGNRVGFLGIHDNKTGEMGFHERIHKGTIEAMTFSSDGSLLISGDIRGKVLVTDMTKHIS